MRYNVRTDEIQKQMYEKSADETATNDDGYVAAKIFWNSFFHLRVTSRFRRRRCLEYFLGISLSLSS